MVEQDNLDNLVERLGDTEFLRDTARAVEFMGDFIRKSLSDGFYLTWRNECYERLGEIGGETASQILRDAIYSEPENNGKFIALKGYVAANQESSIPLLHEMVRYPDFYVRENAYGFLAQFNDTSAIPLLKKELVDFSKFDNLLQASTVFLKAGIAKALYRLTNEEHYRAIEIEAKDLNMKFSTYYKQGREEEYNKLCGEFDSRVKEMINS
jgi:hypothetical protein